MKLNTNESPFAPSEKAMAWGMEHLRQLNLYPDPDCRRLIGALADYHGVGADQVFVGVGSDDVLGMAFMTFMGISL